MSGLPDTGAEEDLNSSKARHTRLQTLEEPSALRLAPIYPAIGGTARAPVKDPAPPVPAEVPRDRTGAFVNAVPGRQAVHDVGLELGVLNSGFGLGLSCCRWVWALGCTGVYGC